MARQTIERADHYEVGFWLIFDCNGNVRLTRGEPNLDRYERAMSVTTKVPFALFNVPQLRATINIDAQSAKVPPIDTTAAGEALKQAIGVDVDLVIHPRVQEPAE